MSNEPIPRPNVSLMHLHKGATFTHLEREYVILSVVDINLILCRENASGAKVMIKLGDIRPPTSADIIVADAPSPAMHDLVDVTPQQWEEATRLHNLIRPLVERTIPKGSYKEAVRDSGMSSASFYRKVEKYRETGLISSLLPAKRPGGRGKGRLSEEVEAIIGAVIREHHLTMQKYSVIATVDEIQRRCRNAKLPIPHLLTIRKRIEWISGRERIAKRESSYAARMKFDPNLGSIPGAEWPLSLVQMDHTPLPVILVSEDSRQPIKKPWLTLSIDVNTRVIPGMYLSLDPPSAMSAGMCTAHSILPKEKWLESRGISVDWPIWGVMDTLHMDNAKEFHGHLMDAVAKDYNIDLHRRPVKTPHYGAHIERLLGTFSEKLKVVPGTTFSNPEQKGLYDSEGNAILTLREAEKWLVVAIAEYHHDVHSELGTTPLQRWREELLGLNGNPPRGLSARRLDEEKVRIDFLPFFERTVQAYGVVIDDMHYYHDVLRPLINVADEKRPKHRKLYRFRRDPRDISRLFYFDPDSKQYYVIPYRDSSRPPISIWELKSAKRTARKRKLPANDENVLFEIANEKREVIVGSAAKSKAARRLQQRQKEHKRSREEVSQQLPKTLDMTPTLPPPEIPGYDPTGIEPLVDE